MADIIKKSGVREAARGMNVGSDVYDELDERAKDLVRRAQKRAQANDRKTIKRRDV